MFKQLVEYLEDNCLINPNHHGARQGLSTATALLQLYDQWIEEVDKGMMVGVMLVDVSAAFDMVDHQLMLKILELLGLNDQSVHWMESYLSKRSQTVCIDGFISLELDINCGVPQGSILGPLLYILFTNDVPELVHNHPVRHSAPTPYCQECGSTVCYVDDSTYSVSSRDPVELSSKLTDQYNIISHYMSSNHLVINADKTHLLVMGTRGTASRRAEVSLNADNYTITASSTEKLLGAHLNQDLKWREHILANECSMIKQLTTRINGLIRISTSACFKTKLMVANGIFQSKLCYLMQVWCGAEQYLVRSLQVVQNRAARVVTGQSWFTPTRILLGKCKWLSVNRLIFYQTVLTAHKIVQSRRPMYLSMKMGTVYPYETRHATDGSIRLGEQFEGKSSLTRTSFCYQGSLNYNRIQTEIRQNRTLHGHLQSNMLNTYYNSKIY